MPSPTYVTENKRYAPECLVPSISAYYDYLRSASITSVVVTLVFSRKSVRRMVVNGPMALSMRNQYSRRKTRCYLRPSAKTDSLAFSRCSSSVLTANKQALYGRRLALERIGLIKHCLVRVLRLLCFLPGSSQAEH